MPQNLPPSSSSIGDLYCPVYQIELECCKFWLFDLEPIVFVHMFYMTRLCYFFLSLFYPCILVIIKQACVPCTLRGPQIFEVPPGPMKQSCASFCQSAGADNIADSSSSARLMHSIHVIITLYASFTITNSLLECGL